MSIRSLDAMKRRSSSVQRLIELNICQPSDIKWAEAEAEKLSTPDFSAKLRRAEKLVGAIGDSNRMKILLLLSKREMCVCELESALGLPQPTVSHHLGLLEQADLLRRSKKGRFVFYEVQNSPVLDLLKNLMS
jgi:DNA-binding transcriptional ArsR family regulator